MPPTAPTTIHVLLVEDSLGDAGLLDEFLRDAVEPGVTVDVRHVDRLAPALRLLASGDALEPRRPDVVLLDLALPDSDGVDTVRRVHEAAPDVPIVVLTGMGQQRLAVEAARHGAHDHLLKDDVDGHLLLSAIRGAIARARA